MRRIFFLISIISIFSCQQKQPEPTELYNMYRNSVVLIQNSYYFKTTLDNGFEFFYTLVEGNPVFYENEEDAIKNAGVSYGTGFFISENGEIATNRHVIYPNKDSKNISNAINEYLSDIKYKIKSLINEAQNDKEKLVDLYNEYYDYIDYDKKSILRDEYTNKQNKIIELEKFLNELDFNPTNTTTEIKRIFLGVAFDNTYVTTLSDFKDCVPIKKSENDDIDLAIIQLKDKVTPLRVEHYFDMKTFKSNQLNLNDEVFMIGFNHGFSLANTSEGIKSQFTQGTITQDPNNNKILYSIPTLPGSSGSPIIDKWGNLAAINFSKTGDFQGFSFGIPSTALLNLYIDDSNKIIDNEIWVSNNKNEIEDYEDNQIKEEEIDKEKISAVNYLNGGFETQTILEYNYNSSSNNYDLKSELKIPSKLFFDQKSYAFKRGNNNWLYANWTYSEFDIKTNRHIFFDNYGQTITFDKNFTTITWYTKSDENNIFQEIITYKILTKNKSIIPDNKKASSTNNITPNSQSIDIKNNEHIGNYLYKTTFESSLLSIPLRSQPNINSNEVYKCPINSIVYVIDNNGELYYKVFVNGYTGYVSKVLLKRKS